MYDINTAAFLQQLHMMLTSVEKLGRGYNFIQGRWWVYYTYDEWASKFLPWTSGATIRRIVAQLEHDNILISTTDPRRPTDRTKWYSINYQMLRDKADAMQNKIADCTSGTAQNEQFIDDSKMSSSNESKWSNVYITNSDNEPDDQKYVDADAPTSSTSEPVPSPTSNTKPPRARNPLFDAIVAAFGWDTAMMTKTSSSMVGKVVAELKQVGIEAHEIASLYAFVKGKGFTNFTPVALTKHAPDWLANHRGKAVQKSSYDDFEIVNG
jgi:hypothetical protein